MKILPGFCFAFLILLFSQTVAPAAPFQESDSKPLFNGTDLDGWDGDPRLWSVKDGVIRGETTQENKANRNTFLIWKGGPLGDFVLKLSFRCNVVNNSGVQYRTSMMDPAGDNKWRVKGYQHEIRNENQIPNVPGFIYDEGGKRGRICLAGEKATWESDGKKSIEFFLNEQQIKDLVRVDDWNDVQIIAKGNHIQHYLNGKLYLDFTDNHPELALNKGLLALQLHAGKPMWTEFRDIWLKDLGNAVAPGTTSTPSKPMNVWPEMAPDETTSETGTAEPLRENETPPIIRIGKVTKPTFTLYPAPKPNGSAVLVLPGGGFNILAADLEGTEIAQWLNKNGYHAFVLHYRVSSERGRDSKRIKAVQDAQRTMSIIRSDADKYGINKDKIGVIGFSAGGLAAASLLAADGKLEYEKIDAIDDAGAKANFAMLIYPSVSAIEPSAQFPPTFIVHTHDDFIPAEEIAMFYAGLKKADVPAELHIYSTGGHGYGLRPRKGSTVSTWIQHAEAFLEMHTK